MEALTPREIVQELDKYIVGQKEAKRAVAIALRNRFRRQKLPKEMAEEIAPKNILMIGPTGVGKTEIARRLARMVNAPFVKVEATKFTEVGYVGRDVEGMVRDLVETAIRMVKAERMQEVKIKAEERANDRLLDLLAPLPKRERNSGKNPFEALFSGITVEEDPREDTDYDDRLMHRKQERERIKERLLAGELEEKVVEVEIEDNSNPTLDVFSGMGMEEMSINIQDMFSGLLPKKKKKRRVTVKEARDILAQEEAQKLIDMDIVVQEAVQRTEQSGMIFIDEIDKVAGKEHGSGPDVSREGVQRDILPIVEGSTVITKYGPVSTNHVLFVAAGAFHMAKPTDLIPELQGRFPIRVELKALGEDDFVRILTEPENALIKQYQALLAADGVTLQFTDEGIREIARMAERVNEASQNIGARRLHTILERLLEEISFAAPDVGETVVRITPEYVRERLGDIVEDRDLSKYIL